MSDVLNMILVDLFIGYIILLLLLDLVWIVYLLAFNIIIIYNLLGILRFDSIMLVLLRLVYLAKRVDYIGMGWFWFLVDLVLIDLG